MQVEEYLKNYQPVIYQTFINSLQSDKLSHAYLISGNPGTPLLETAKFLAKSILCDDPSPLACNSCITCLRVDDDNYPDYIVFNGEEETIGKKDVELIEKMFEKEAFERKGIRIYILHLIENMTIEATNSLLKFLEEPQPNIYAFLTTNNENIILPTIISRCQGFTLKSIARKEVIEDAKEMMVNDEDAEFLSYFYNEPNLIYELVEDKMRYKEYLAAKEPLMKFLEAITRDRREAIFIAQNEVSPSLNNKNSLKFFIDMLSQVLEDVVNVINHRPVILESDYELLEKLSKKISNPSEALLEVLKVRSVVGINVNNALIIDHLVYSLLGDNK